MKKIQYILFFTLAMGFVACKKEVIVPINSVPEQNVTIEENYSSKSMTIINDDSGSFDNGDNDVDNDENSIVDPTGRPKPARPGSGGSKKIF